ncbi:unnamed protein product, partial [Symbiodinium sp. CCMP2456]
AWSAAAESANALADIPSTMGLVSVRRQAQDELNTRTFSSAVDPINYDQDEEEENRGHVPDAARDQAREDRSFSRSTAKLTPQLFAELTGPGSSFGSGRSVIEADSEAGDPHNLLGPVGEPTSFRQAILSTRLANLQFVLAVEAESPGQFAAQVFEWTASSAKEAHESLALRTHMLEQFWTFARAAE